MLEMTLSAIAAIFAIAALAVTLRPPPEEPTWQLRTKRVVIDLDGTLCHGTRGTDYSGAIPYKQRIRKLNKMRRDMGLYVIICTARGSQTGFDWVDVTKLQLDAWGVEYDLLRVGKKPGADVYVDDRAMRPEEFFGV